MHQHQAAQKKLFLITCYHLLQTSEWVDRASSSFVDSSHFLIIADFWLNSLYVFTIFCQRDHRCTFSLCLQFLYHPFTRFDRMFPHMSLQPRAPAPAANWQDFFIMTAHSYVIVKRRSAKQFLFFLRLLCPINSFRSGGKTQEIYS